MNKKQKRRWHRRVQEMADKLSIEKLPATESWDPKAARAIGEYMAARMLITLDGMKRPGPLHLALRRKET